MTKELIQMLRQQAREWHGKAKKLEDAADIVEANMPGEHGAKTKTAISDEDINSLGHREAAFRILEMSTKPMTKQEVFKRLLEKGYAKMKDYKALNAIFSRNKEQLVSLGDGRWTLKGKVTEAENHEPELPIAGGK